MLTKFKENRVDILCYLTLILFTAGVGYISLGKNFDFDIYPSLAGDAFFGNMLIKSIQENGPLGVIINSRIGAPESASMIDYPVLGNMMVVFLWIISWFTSSTSGIMYIYLILTFALDGVSMALLLRKLNMNWETTFVVGSLFAFAPYHFYRYLGHSSLINYMFVPIAIYLACNIIGIIQGESKWKLVFLTIVLGLGYGYYYAFGLIVLAVAYLIRFIKLEKKRDIYKDIWIIILLLTTILTSLMPKIIYSALYGSNIEAGKRLWFEQEMYGLKIINLLLPVNYSRIDSLKKLTDTYCTSAPLVTENAMAGLGVIASIGFLSLCIGFIVSFVNKARTTGKEWELIDFLALSTLTFVLVGTVGGFGEIINWAITSQIRCYNRASIFIAGFSLVMIAILFNKIKLKVKWISFLACALILGIGIYDQVCIYPANWQEAIRPTQEMYESYFSDVEDSLNEEAMVYQLPYMDFPEMGSIYNIPDYKLFAGYLFTDNLRWSYGAVRGRNLEARELNVDEGMSYDFLTGIKQAGFDAVYIDLDGYVDGGQKILEFYNGLGISPIVSADGKLYVYDISTIANIEECSNNGYWFVRACANYSAIKIPEEELISIAEGLSNMNEDSYEILYSWLAHNSTTASSTDEEYVDWLYTFLLNREADEEEKIQWVATIQDGTTREKIFYTFLNSDEFRTKQKMDVDTLYE